MISNSAPRRSILAFFLVAGVLYAPMAFFASVNVFPNISLFNLAAFIPATAALRLPGAHVLGGETAVAH